MILRGMLPKSKGVIHWSISSVTKNPKLSETLLEGAYKKQALVPASPWLDNSPPLPPTVTTDIVGDKLKINWTAKDQQDVFRTVVYYKYGTVWSYKILSHKDRFFEINRKGGTEKAPLALSSIAVTSVDRTGNESEVKEISIAQ